MPKQLSRFRYPPKDKLGTEAFSYVEQLSQTDRDRLITSVRGSGTSTLPTNDPMTTDASAPGNGEGTGTPVDKSLYGWSDVPVTASSLDPGSVHMLARRANYLGDVKRAR